MAADICLIADNFVFKKHSNHNRCLIKYADGTKWLTVPVFHHGLKDKSLNKILIDHHEQWQKKHLLRLQNSYIHAAYYFYYIDRLKDLLYQNYTHLIDINQRTLKFLLESLNLNRQLQSTLTLSKMRCRTARMISWMKECNCDTCILEEFELPLVDQKKIKTEGYRIRIFKDRPVNYYQLFENYVYPISALDIVMNEGLNGTDLLVKSLS